VRSAAVATGIATLVGSGVSLENLASYTAADALIIGSSVKDTGAWTGHLDEPRAAALARALGS
jgi:predicted TIM-barrel enzyme